jgi:tetratricopeptide (TPR) repeat protein/tRNA A-37 threonylcarbamoyl transferase component Bud32
MHTLDDDVLDLLAAWEERYRGGDDATIESLGATDPDVVSALRDLINKQKWLYAQMHLGPFSDDSDSNEPEPPPTFPDYEVLDEIGRGGMGVVYKARDVKLGRLVALKTIAEGRHASADLKERFRAEALAAGRLRHPHIVVIHAIGEHEGLPYLALEYVEGGSLSQRLAQGPMPVLEGASVVETLAKAVHVAHTAGIIHRDLKPSNVLLAADGSPKVSDFGLAKLLGSDSARTLSGQVLGSPSYMAPEQAEGHARQVGPAADIYALGAILYHALTGRPPFLGGSVMETLQLAVTTDAVPPRRLRPDVPRDLETICLKCLEKEPQKRYESALAVAEDLRRFQEGKPIAARPLGGAGRLVRWCRRNPKLAGLAAALALTFALGTPTLIGLWLRASAARAQAQLEADNSKAINEFLQNDLLAQASAHNQARPGTRPDPDLKVRTALDRAGAKIGERFGRQPLVEASIRQTIGQTYYELGLYQQALPHTERALALRRRALGDSHGDTLDSMSLLGSIYLSDGKLAEADSLLAPVMERLKTTQGLADPRTLAAIVKVGELYQAQSKHAEAERLLELAHQGYEQARGASRSEALDSAYALALVYESQGKHDQSERLLKRTIEELRVEFGPDHPATLTAMSSLARLWSNLHRRYDAERLFREVLEAQRKTLGNKHRDTLFTLMSLGEIYVIERRLDQAESILLEAADGCRSSLDANHDFTATVLAWLAALYSTTGNVKKLAPVLTEAAEITRTRFGPDHGLTLGAVRTAGLFFLTQNDYVQAERYLRECLNYILRHDPERWDRFAIESALARCLIAEKRYPEAEPLLLSAYRGLKAAARDAPDDSVFWLKQTVAVIVTLTERAPALNDQAAFAEIRAEPRFQGLALDAKFPSKPFAPPIGPH